MIIFDKCKEVLLLYAMVIPYEVKQQVFLPYPFKLNAIRCRWCTDSNTSHFNYGFT